MKRILLLVFLLMLSSFAEAQFSSVMTEDPNYRSDSPTIVRRLSDTEVITYVRAISLHRFTYENNSTLSYNYIDLTSSPFDNIVINDFRIIDDLIYFCGSNISSGFGVLGVIKASYLLSSLGTTVPVDFFDIQGTSELYRLDVYIDPTTNTPRVTAVGYYRNPSCGMWACGVGVDCAGLMPGTLAPTCSVFYSYNNSPLDIEHWEDVVSTTEWVVLVGAGYLNGQEGLFLRKFPKGNPSDPEVFNIYFYPESESLMWNEVRAEYLKENEIAVVYRGTRVDMVTNYTKFRVFDISSMANFISQEYVVPYKCFIHEMAYMERAERVVLASMFPSPVMMAHLVYITPYLNVPYPTVYVHDKLWNFCSVTNLDDDYFVASGCFHFLLRSASASFPAYNGYSLDPPYCPEEEQLNVEIIENIDPDVSPNPPAPVIVLPPNNSHTFILQNSPLSIRCFSY